eukprot:403359201
MQILTIEKLALKKEVTEQGLIELNPSGKVVIQQITKFTTYFGDNNQKNFEQGFSQIYDQNNERINFEIWKTEHHSNIYQKEKYHRYIKQLQQNQTGEKEGRNQYGQFWQEKWYQSWDGRLQGFSKMTTEENDQFKLSWGESQDSHVGHYLKSQIWQEKLQKHDNYWENSWDQKITYQITSEKNGVNTEGQKIFKNNREYFYDEEWREFQNGEIKVKKYLDDGFGHKNTEYFTLVKRGDLVECEYTTGIAEDVSQNRKIETQKGKNYLGLKDEWENKKILDFNQNFEKISNTGKNNLGFWKEEWGEQNQTKWAYKEGQNFFTNEQWKEEWYEKRKDDNLLEEHKVEKWGKNAFEEWNEQWGEINNNEKKEKWADKWAVDLNSGYRRGENWGHTFDSNLQPKQHWIEYWDSEGKLQKRSENY